MTTSTIPEVKAALVSLMSSAPGLEGIQVVREHPGSKLEREAIIVGRARGRHEPASIKSGRQPRDESYSVEVIATVLGSGEDHYEAEERAYELIAEAEDVVAGDPHLGLTSILWAIPGDIEDRAGQTDSGPVAEVLMRVDVKARLA